MTGRPPKDEPRKLNTELIAFRDVQVEGVRISYVDPVRRRPLDVSIEQLIVRPDENDVLDLDLQGTVNELPLWADGKLGPWQNLLDGKDLTADLDVTLGQVRLAVEGSAEDVRALAGVEATFALSGPSIDRVAGQLGSPPFAEGPFQIDGRLRKLDRGHQIRFEGNLGEIDVLASGSIDRFVNPDSTQFDFNVSGPGARYVAEVFGIYGVPDVPFQVSGDVKQEGKRLAFTGTRAELGENSVALDGWFDASAASTDVDVTIEASGPDFSVFAPFMNVKGIPAEAFDIDGRIEKSGKSWRFSEVVGIVGDNRIAANGSIGDGEETEIEFRAAGPDISFMEAMTGRVGLPKKPFDVSARIKPAREGIGVEDATGRIGDNRIDVDGVVGTGPGLAGTQLVIRGSGSELRNVSLLAGIPYLPDGQFEFAGNVEVDGNRLVVSDVSASVGDMQASATAIVGMGPDVGEFDLVVTASGPDVGDLASIDSLQRMSGEPFSLSGHVKRQGDDNELDFEDTQVRIGEIALNADGTLSMEPLSNDSDLKFELSGPDMQQLGRAFGTDAFFAKTYDITGQFTGTPGGFAMRNFVARIADDDLSGVFEIDLQGKPRLTGTLSSTHVDLTERLQQVEEQRKEAPKREDNELLLSDERIDTDFLQAVDIDVDLTVDNLQADILEVTDFHVGVRLEDGELHIDPITFAELQGSLEGQASLVPADGGYVFDVLLAVKGMHLGFVASPEQERSTLPPASGELKLHGAGNSFHELMASANGTVSLRQSSGRIKDFGTGRLFGDLLLEIVRALNPLREEEEYQTFDCGIYDIDVIDGVVNIENFALQSDTMTVIVLGNLDFNTEKLDLAIRAKPREGLGISIGAVVNSFLKLGGTLQKPELQIDPEGTIVAGGVAVATGGLSLLAKGLFDRMSAQADICTQEEADQED